MSDSAIRMAALVHQAGQSFSEICILEWVSGEGIRCLYRVKFSHDRSADWGNGAETHSMSIPQDIMFLPNNPTGPSISEENVYWERDAQMFLMFPCLLLSTCC